MSSDIMIICKEFTNFYGGLDMTKEHKIIESAVCIGEASMGDPGEHNEFANWFISRYYSGMTMLEQVTARNMDEKMKSDMQFQHEVFTETDLIACRHALENMSCPYLTDKKGREAVFVYLQKCLGKHVSTENW